MGRMLENWVFSFPTFLKKDSKIVFNSYGFSVIPEFWVSTQNPTLGSSILYIYCRLLPGSISSYLIILDYICVPPLKIHSSSVNSSWYTNQIIQFYFFLWWWCLWKKCECVTWDEWEIKKNLIGLGIKLEHSMEK